jgi:uncharacterized protein (DUF697 family)
MEAVKWVLGLIFGIVAIVVGLALLPVVFTSVGDAVNSTSNSTYQTMIGIIPLVVIAGIIISVLYLFLRE